jgi:hypothetical protein
MSDIFTREKSLSYNGFNIAIISKRKRSKSHLQELSYVVIKRNESVLTKFGGPIDHPLTTTDIGLFPILGGKTKQLIISQTVPRGGRHWIVELTSNPKVLFDSGDYEVGRESAPFHRRPESCI